MSIVNTIAALEACYPTSPTSASTVREVARLTPSYRALIKAAPFVVLTTSGPGRLDCSPQGGAPGFVHIVDDNTLVLPDRLGDDRLDCLGDIVVDPRVALLFLIPSCGVTLRISGRAVVSIDVDLLAAFGPRDPPITAIVVTVESARVLPPRAVLKAALWKPVTWGNPEHLPSSTEILEEVSAALADERALESA